MSLAKLHRWHWLLISVVIGIAVPMVREAMEGELYGLQMDGYGVRLTDQGRFEDALVQEFEGRRLFKDVTVYPRWANVPGHGREPQLVYVVAGKYFGGRPEAEAGKWVARWNPTYFVASVPYRPRGYPPGVSVAALKRFTALPRPTVRDYLDLVGSARGPGYAYAWWEASPRLTWLIGSVLLLGAVWPTLVNLYLYGSIRRPPEDVNIGLIGPKVSGAAAPRPAAAPVVDPAYVAASDESLSQATADARAAVPTSAAAPRKLEAGPLPAVAPTAGEEHEYGQKADDFYPVDRHRAKGASGGS